MNSLVAPITPRARSRLGKQQDKNEKLVQQKRRASIVTQIKPLKLDRSEKEGMMLQAQEKGNTWQEQANQINQITTKDLVKLRQSLSTMSPDLESMEFDLDEFTDLFAPM
ncbi:Hypothetical_protein [Hexamita inflata]|uniref:Hypothetical_protein n=1 Tax=Hexamita inflata TaxID=28002 RepID=A0ABP1GLN1_9EUKA